MPDDPAASDRAELERLRRAAGGDESSLLQTRLELLAARDAVIGLEAEAGRLRAELAELEELSREYRGQRDHYDGLRRQHEARASALEDQVLGLQRLVAHLEVRVQRYDRVAESAPGRVVRAMLRPFRSPAPR